MGDESWIFWLKSEQEERQRTVRLDVDPKLSLSDLATLKWHFPEDVAG